MEDAPPPVELDMDKIRLEALNDSVVEKHRNTVAEAIAGFRTKSMRKCIEMYDEITMTTAAGIIHQFRDGGCANLDPWQFERIMGVLLSLPVQYDGVDYHLPSKYMDAYGHYLLSSESGLDGAKGGHRIIIADKAELQKDGLDPKFVKFYDWHERNGVRLHHVTPPMMGALLKKYKIDARHCASGMGLWRNEFGMLFGGFADNHIRVEIMEQGGQEFDRLTRLYNEIIENSRVIKSPGAYKEIPESLAGNWWDYVNPEKRWQGIRPFVTGFMKKDDGWIIDAASGIGVEYYYMLKEGYMMVANEYQKELIEAGRTFFREAGAGMPYEPMQKDWRALDNMAFTNKFAGVMMVGNSLRTLPDAAGQQSAADTFCRMLRDGGMIIIDERNADKFMKKERDIIHCEKNPEDTETFCSLDEFASNPPNRMYHSEQLRSIPCAVEPSTGEIRFRYYKKGEKNARNMGEVRKRQIHEWGFLHGDKMEDILDNAGFVDVQKYADYKTESRLEPYETTDAACMFVYVARKPK